MAQKWHQKATVQGAIAAGVLAVLAAVIGIVPSFFERGPASSQVAQVPASANESHELVEYISINYARLFGAFQVPFLLSTSQEVCGGSENAWAFLGTGDEGFWDRWEYKNARPLRSAVWDEVFVCDRNGKGEVFEGAHALLRAANANDPETTQAFYHASNEMYDSNSQETREVEAGSPKTPYDFLVSADPGVLDAVEINASNVGFLVLYLQNTADRSVADLDIYYTEYDHNNELGAPVDASVVEARLAGGAEFSKRVPLLQSGGQVLLLLAAYIRNEDGYPAEYLTSVTRPTRLSYRMQGSRETLNQDVRLPLRDKAAKVEIPFGWYWQ